MARSAAAEKARGHPSLEWLLFVVATALVAGCRPSPTTPLRVPPAAYASMVSAFYAGTLALGVGDNQRAAVRLEEATRIVPDEPAPWANLAVLHLRTHNYDRAAVALAKALALAPPTSHLEWLSGLLAGQRGNSGEALAHLRRAVELEPGNLRARYALVEELARQSGTESERERQRQLEAIRVADPGNLVALLELARGAARAGSAAGLREYASALRAGAASWPPEARGQLAAVERTLASDRPLASPGLITQLAVLGNQLKPSPEYQRSIAVLRNPDATLGRPLERFLRLPAPDAVAAPPDTGLTFASEPVGEWRAEWAAAFDLRPGVPAQLGSAPPPDAPPELLLGQRDGLLLVPALKGGGVTRASLRLPVAGGPAGDALSPDGALAIDWNNDFLPDLALAGPEGLRLYRQATANRWQEVSDRGGLPAATLRAAYTGAWAVDVDLDGDLDIALGTLAAPLSVLRNNGDESWSVVRPFPGLRGMRSFAWADFDGDGDPDVALLDGRGSLVVFDNHRAGGYVRAPVPSVARTSLALSVADADHDGALDLVTLQPDGGILRLSRRPGGDWASAELARWPAAPAAGGARLSWGDLDNNGAADLVASNARGSSAWLAGSGGALQALAATLDGRILSLVDLNADGRLDLLGTSAGGAVTRLLNRGTTGYRWEVIRPRGQRIPAGNQKINSFGIGGEAEVRAGLLAQKQPVAGPRVHFGLGQYARADVLRVVWPNGQPQAEFDLAVDQAIVAEQRLTGSCPWLFAFDGQSVRFVTDILWKSPLGLRINAQVGAAVSQTRDWVRIRGDQLRPRGGEYDLRITAELWETNFFDHVSLMVVDHPAGTEIFVDERFALPQPPLAIHVLDPPLPVAQAIDDRGADVTELVRARDGRYAASFPLGRYQGVARDHFLEVTVPAATTRSGPLQLVAHGWVYPTDSSLNVALSQGHTPPPRGLSLEVPDERGGWRTARVGLGFPAGKRKTVILDLTGLFPAGRAAPRRVRLRTNLEIYWDSLAVAAPAREGVLRRQVVAPSVAELRPRGFSVTTGSRREPEVPDYTRLASTSQRWSDLPGFYTRFGDVRELLAGVDDRYVIMNAGDEIALRFPALPAAAAGEVRDFIFVSDGWDKDGNLNTGFSDAVLPLPSHDAPEYTRPPGPLADDPVFRRHPRDWEEYHTRYVNAAAFKAALRPSR